MSTERSAVRPSAAHKSVPRKLVVRALSAASRIGIAELGPLHLTCALGRGGVKVHKREGDGATPRGSFDVRFLYYNPSRMRRPRSGLQARPLDRDDGWCDAPGDRNYNRPVRHPYPASAERLWRTDGLYDIILVVSYNERPRIKGRGSAIFIHLAGSDLSPTEGCIALKPRDMRRLLPHLGQGVRLVTAV